MSNINTFFDNAPMQDKLRQNSKEEPDQNDVLIMDDIEEFGESFSNLNDIKKLNSEKNNENNEKNKQVPAIMLETENKLLKPIVNKLDYQREKTHTTKTIPIINSEAINGKNVSSNIDSLFSNYKNSSLFNSNMNSITNNNLSNGRMEKETKAAELEQKISAVNLNEPKNFNNNLNNNNRNNLNSENYGNQIFFERNTKLRNNAAINSNNSNKELINLLNKPVNNFESRQASNLIFANANANKNNAQSEQENIKGFSNLNNNNNIHQNINNINNINNSNNNQINKRYQDLNSRQGTRNLDNNTSINMNSAKNKNLNAYNNTRTIQESSRNQIINYNNNNLNNGNSPNLNRISDSDQVNYDKFKTPTAERQSQNQEFHSVKEYAAREEMNPKYKNNMEDYVKIIDKFNENSKMGLFSLYDGHGGEDPVKYVKDRLPEILAKFIKNSNDSIDNCLISAFEKVDNELKFYDSENTGTTATVAVINCKNLFLANVGDSRCVLVNGTFEVKKLSFDHKCSDESEIERIKSSGGMIFNNRVFGQLALTRALGDHAIKKYGVISTPYVAKYEVKTGDFIVIASDGVWDVTSDEDIKGFFSKGGKCSEIVDSIVLHSLSKGSRDNISCVVVKI